MHKKLNQAAGNASFNDGLNLVVGTIREIRNSPAGIDKNFVIQ